MSQPVVSFVVPCYKLAHLLPECVKSILQQTYQNFEILIMDDASPDNTAEVAQSFGDPRVRHIRNEPNLGHLRNYNKGITLSRGKYVWLISADDYLRKPYVLERYVNFMERHPSAGYAFCPVYGVRDGVETIVFGRYSQRGDRDRFLRGHTLLARLIQSNFVGTPSGMVRRECYERVSQFDLNMPWCGDWYLWCLFALHYDAAYFAEPMVCYREHHDLSMTTHLTSAKLDACGDEELAVAWGIRRHALDAGHAVLAKRCLLGVARTYGRLMTTERYRPSKFFMNFERFEESICQHTSEEAERRFLRAQVSMSIGNEFYWQGDRERAKEYYASALRASPWLPTVRAKTLLLGLGKPGDIVRKTVLAFR